MRAYCAALELGIVGKCPCVEQLRICRRGSSRAWFRPNLNRKARPGPHTLSTSPMAQTRVAAGLAGNLPNQGQSRNVERMRLAPGRDRTRLAGATMVREGSARTLSHRSGRPWDCQRLLLRLKQSLSRAHAPLLSLVCPQRAWARGVPRSRRSSRA